MHAGGGADPYTGSAAVTTHHIPAKAYLLFDSVPPTEAMRRKIAELSASSVAADPGTASLALSAAELAEGGALDALLDR